MSKTKLLVNTPDPLRVMYVACKTCYSADNALGLWYKDHNQIYAKEKLGEYENECPQAVYDLSTQEYFCKYEAEDLFLRICACDFDGTLDECTIQAEKARAYDEAVRGLPTEKELMLALVLKVFRSGHLTIAEHINFTFAIADISRACSHQLVRHRHATFSQKSQRYVQYHKPFEYVMPESIKNTLLKPMDGDLTKRFSDHMRDTQSLYEAFLDEGIPAEDARYVFPNACETSMIMTCNLRELIHICNLRLCLHAQWEIRGLVEKMRNEVVKLYPWLGEFLVPKCKTCTEFKKCERNKGNSDEK